MRSSCGSIPDWPSAPARTPPRALCLTGWTAAPLGGRQVIDYGCGSGVLAIAALKLGARRAYAFDIDPQALLATRENAARQRGRRPRCGSASTRTQLPQECDVVVANILSETLVALAPGLAARCLLRRPVLLSGILEPQEPEVAACYSPWFDMRRFAARDGWVALHGQRH